ncbi:MAG: CDP-alcohol phosphatidyltransferase family protein [Gemmatimonadetes bacterium]|nr:CDP-alcohol phosphatidyltransferase family protein [Gemmatimonadota bacterium]
MSDRPAPAGRPAAKWLPNALTGLRILLLPLLVFLLVESSTRAAHWNAARSLALAVFAVMAVTDWIDGYLARRLGAISRLGSVVDALADRLALLVPLAYLAVWEPAGFPEVPLWIPAWLVGLDLVTGLAWGIARSRGDVRAPRSHHQVGRVGVWLLFVLILWALAGLPSAGIAPLALAGLGLSTVSGLLYIREWMAASA